MPPLSNGSFRNHCHACLWSLHLDVAPGDRANDCHGSMEPVLITQPRGKKLAVVHECTRCGHRQTNRLALDDPVSDSIETISAIQTNALTQH